MSHNFHSGRLDRPLPAADIHSTEDESSSTEKEIKDYQQRHYQESTFNIEYPSVKGFTGCSVHVRKQGRPYLKCITVGFEIPKSWSQTRHRYYSLLCWDIPDGNNAAHWRIHIIAGPGRHSSIMRPHHTTERTPLCMTILKIPTKCNIPDIPGPSEHKAPGHQPDPQCHGTRTHTQRSYPSC